jgi:choline dehydrogenase-like flavoprotein
MISSLSVVDFHGRVYEVKGLRVVDGEEKRPG